MRQLQDRTGFHAEANRLNKALALTLTIRKHYGATQEVIDALPTQEWEWWEALAKEAHVNPPSPATVEAVIGLLASHDHPENPLEGLPS